MPPPHHRAREQAARLAYLRQLQAKKEGPRPPSAAAAARWPPATPRDPPRLPEPRPAPAAARVIMGGAPRCGHCGQAFTAAHITDCSRATPAFAALSANTAAAPPHKPPERAAPCAAPEALPLPREQEPSLSYPAPGGAAAAARPRALRALQQASRNAGISAQAATQSPTA